MNDKTYDVHNEPKILFRSKDSGTYMMIPESETKDLFMEAYERVPVGPIYWGAAWDTLHLGQYPEYWHPSPAVKKDGQ